MSLEVLLGKELWVCYFCRKEQALLCRKPRSLCHDRVCVTGTLPACLWALSADGIPAQSAVDCPCSGRSVLQ